MGKSISGFSSQRRLILPAEFVLLITATAVISCWPVLRSPMCLAILAYGCLVAGVLARKQVWWHWRLMLTGITLDVALVLFLAVTRNAAMTAVSNQLTFLQSAHVLVSTLAVICYGPAVFYGVKRLKGNHSPELRRRHLRAGVAALVFRTLGLIFMFSMLSRHV